MILLTVQELSKNNIVPSKFQGKWNNFVNIIINFRFRVSIIYRKRNVCVEKTVKVGFYVHGLVQDILFDIIV